MIEFLIFVALLDLCLLIGLLFIIRGMSRSEETQLTFGGPVIKVPRPFGKKEKPKIRVNDDRRAFDIEQAD